MTPKEQKEYERIEKGPPTGYFTFVHHGGPIAEYSDNIMRRLRWP